jgi:hypothetical protein
VRSGDIGIEDEVGDATGAVFADLRTGVLFEGASDAQSKFNCSSDLLGTRKEEETVGVVRPVTLPRTVGAVVGVISFKDEVR